MKFRWACLVRVALWLLLLGILARTSFLVQDAIRSVDRLTQEVQQIRKLVQPWIPQE